MWDIYSVLLRLIALWTQFLSSCSPFAAGKHSSYAQVPGGQWRGSDVMTATLLCPVWPSYLRARPRPWHCSPSFKIVGVVMGVVRQKGVNSTLHLISNLNPSCRVDCSKCVKQTLDQSSMYRGVTVTEPSVAMFRVTSVHQGSVSDFRVPPRCKWGLRSSGMLYSVHWKVVSYRRCGTTYQFHLQGSCCSNSNLLFKLCILSRYLSKNCSKSTQYATIV